MSVYNSTNVIAFYVTAHTLKIQKICCAPCHIQVLSVFESACWSGSLSSTGNDPLSSGTVLTLKNCLFYISLGKKVLLKWTLIMTTFQFV